MKSQERGEGAGNGRRWSERVGCMREAASACIQRMYPSCIMCSVYQVCEPQTMGTQKRDPRIISRKVKTRETTKREADGTLTPGGIYGEGECIRSMIKSHVTPCGMFACLSLEPVQECKNG